MNVKWVKFFTELKKIAEADEEDLDNPLKALLTDFETDKTIREAIEQGLIGIMMDKDGEPLYFLTKKGMEYAEKELN